LGILLGDKKDRQQVHIAALDKHVALKLENMKYEPRPLDSLSIKELKVVLKYKKPSLDPAEILQMNPGLSHMMDDQIRQAANQSCGNSLNESWSESHDG
jgi:hypothetical protein